MSNISLGTGVGLTHLRSGGGVPGVASAAESLGLDPTQVRLMQAAFAKKGSRPASQGGSSIILEDTAPAGRVIREPLPGRVVDFGETTNGYAYAPLDAAISSYPITLMCRFKTGVPAGNETLLSLSRSGGAAGFVAIIASTGQLYLLRQNLAGTQANGTIESGTGLYDDQRHSVIVCITSDTAFTAWVDGVESAAVTGLTAIDFATMGLDRKALSTARVLSPTHYGKAETSQAALITGTTITDSIAWQLHRLTTKYYSHQSIRSELDGLVGLSNVIQWWDGPGVNAGVEPSVLPCKKGNALIVTNGDPAMVVEDADARCDYNSVGGSEGYQYDGSNDYHDTGQTFDSAGGELIVDFIWDGGGSSGVAGVREATSVDHCFIYAVSNGDLRGYIGTGFFTFTGVTLVAGEPIQAQMAWNGNDVQLYVDGVLTRSETFTGSIDAVGSCFIGAVNNNQGTDVLNTTSLVSRVQIKDSSGATTFDTRVDGWGTASGSPKLTYLPTSLADESLDISGNAAESVGPCRLPSNLQNNPCIAFDSADSKYATISNSEDWSGVDWSVSFWMAASDYSPVTDNVLISQANGTGTGRNWFLIDSSGRFESGVVPGGFTTIAMPTDGDPCFVQLLHDSNASEVTLTITYADGTQATETKSVSGFPAANGNLLIATRVTLGGAFLDGWLSNLTFTRDGQTWARYPVTASDEGGGTVADHSGNGRTMTLTNWDAATWATTQNVTNGHQDIYNPKQLQLEHGSNVTRNSDPVGNVPALNGMPVGAVFNGSTSVVVSSGSVTLFDNSRIELWFKPTVSGANQTLLNGPNGNYTLLFNAEDLLTVQAGGTILGVTRYIATEPPVLNDWNYVIVENDGTALAVTINGVVETATLSGLNSVTGTLFVGRRNTAGLFFGGSIRGLSIVNNGTPTIKYDLLSDTLDSSGNNNHGTATDLVFDTEDAGEVDAYNGNNSADDLNYSRNPSANSRDRFYYFGPKP